MDDRRDGIEEGERILAGEIADRRGERRRGEGPGRDDDAVANRAAAGAETSLRSMVTRASPASAAVTASAKPSRSTASAPPAGT